MSDVPVGFEGQAALLRSDVVEALVQIRREEFPAYYVGAGDLIGPAPDDLLSLEQA